MNLSSLLLEHNTSVNLGISVDRTKPLNSICDHRSPRRKSTRCKSVFAKKQLIFSYAIAETEIAMSYDAKMQQIQCSSLVD